MTKAAQRAKRHDVMCRQRRAGTYLIEGSSQQLVRVLFLSFCAHSHCTDSKSNIFLQNYWHLSTVKDETKQRTSWTTAITIAHKAQHSTTGYSSWKFGFDLTNIICKQGNHQSPKNKDLKKGNCGKQGGEDVDGVRDVDQAGCRVLKSRTWFQIWRVHVHQQNPQDHLGAFNYNGYIFSGVTGPPSPSSSWSP